VKRFLWTLKVLFSHWGRHPMQFATLVVGLICATALWSGVQALNQQSRASYERAATIFGGLRTASLVSPDRATFSQGLFIELRRGGWAVSPMLEDRVQIAGRSLRLVGVEPITMPREAVQLSGMEGGDLENFLKPPHRTLISGDTLDELGLKAGDTPQLKNGFTLPPLAQNPSLAPGVIVVDIGVAQRALDKAGQVSRLLIASKPLGPARPLADIAADHLRLVPADSETGLEQLTDSFHLNLTAFGFLSFAVGLFIVNSAIGLTFEQRRSTFRTVRACGISALTLNIAIITELVSFALIAGLIGMLAGFAMAAFMLPNVAATLRSLYGAEIPGQLSLQPSWWGIGLAMTVAGTLVAATNAMVRLRRLSIVASAQTEAWRRSQQSLLKRQGMVAGVLFMGAVAVYFVGNSLAAGFALLGALMLGAALALPILLSLLLRIGEREADRRFSNRPMIKWFWADGHQQLSGLSLALMALLLALAINVGVGTMVGSFRETFLTWLDGRLSADIYLDVENDTKADAVKSWLQRRPEHIAILPGARTETTIQGVPIEVFGLASDDGYRSKWPLLNATPDAWREISSGHAAFLSEQFARRSGLKLGDTLQVPTEKGKWPVRIVGVYADYGNPRGQFAVDVDALLKQFPRTPRTRIALNIPDQNRASLIEAIKSEFKLSDRQVADQTVVKQESRRIFERTFAVTAALNSFTLGVAAIALLTSLLTLADARLPSWAPIWALGTTLRSLGVLELMQMLMLAFFTALFAVPLGLLVGWCLLAVVNVQAFGWRLPLHVFPLDIIKLLGVTLLAAFFSAIIPVLKLSRMKPAQLVKVFADER